MFVSQALKLEVIELLKGLIATPSFSKEEANTALIISDFFHQKNIPVKRLHNNIWVRSKYTKVGVPTILLNTHHDTVRPVSGWQRNPFEPTVEKGILYGLGSNDAGASLAALAAVFVHFYEKKDLPFNLVFLVSAEEEISGKNGVATALSHLGAIDFGIVGEPTEMQMAVAERGLMVIDGVASGKAGHAAREEGVNAIYSALKDIDCLQQLQFDKVSEQLGKVKVSVTQINAGKQHNIVPDECHFVVDVRTTDAYTNQEVLALLQKKVSARLSPRSFRLSASGISMQHPLVKVGQSLGLSAFGSATLSDQALMPFPTLKIGPGDSGRSHTADEYILIEEIEKGIECYCKILEGLIVHYEVMEELL